MKNKMKKITWLVLVAAISIPLLLKAQTPRQQVLFNDNWKFYKGEMASAQEENFYDANWRKLALPHDYSVEGPFSKEWASGTAYLPGGVGWYRKTFSTPGNWKGKNIFIYFDGVYKNSEVWINGHTLGKRPNGFIPFQYELTPYLKAGKNIIAVKTDHTKFADSRWYTGSGIYRNVYLQAVSPIHIDFWGVAFTTPVVTPQSATARINVAIKNTGKSAAGLTVKAMLADPSGKQVAIAEKRLNKISAGNVAVDLSFKITDPLLWSVDAPNLYKLKISVGNQNEIVDEWTDEVGLRSFRFDANEGFFLNGINIKQKGVCIHDDAGVLGVAVPEAVWIRRLRMLKAAGCNAIRMSHNPHADYLYRLCDELGFLVMDEAFDEWEAGKNKWVAGWNKGTPSKEGYHEYFKQWAQQDTRDMVLRNRNRPSIIMWSIGNEIDYPNDPYSHPVLNKGNNPQISGKGALSDHPSVTRLSELSKQLTAAVKAYDTTRAVTAALAGVVMSNETDFPRNLDIVGYNYQENRYAADHAKYPDRIIYGSENGMQLSAWEAVDTNRYISGQYLWTGIDYLGEAREYPNRSNTAGLLNLAGFTKPEYYFRQSLWSDKPMVFIGTSAIPKSDDKGIWSHKRSAPLWNGKEGDSIRVSCFTNCPEAELFLNGKSLGKKKLTDTKERVLFWDITYQQGTLIIKGFKQGEEMATEFLSTPGKQQFINTTVFKDALIDENAGLKQIEISLCDAANQTLYEADNEVEVKVTGNARLLGLESGNANDVSSYGTSKTKAMNGKLIAYVLPSATAPSFTVEIISAGLKPVIMRFIDGVLR